MSSNNLDANLIARTIGFHGLPLQKIWEGERGDSDLIENGVSNPDLTTYQERQRNFTLQDRAKRLKLHQFIAKNANRLFDRSVSIKPTHKIIVNKTEAIQSHLCADVPTYDTFLSKIDKGKRLKYVYKLFHYGDIVYGTIHSKVSTGIIIKLLCTGQPNIRILTDLNAKAYIPNTEIIPCVDRKGTPRIYMTNDLVCCEILNVMENSEKMICGMKGLHGKPAGITFGLITTEHLPDMFKATSVRTSTGGITINITDFYDEILESSPSFRNGQSLDYLTASLGLDSEQYYTNMSGLRDRFPNDEYASELRQSQASKWAFRSVAEGIEHFKEGRHSEAFQCLNKALNIDPHNVEGLVARGALYANSGSFKKAVDDFENALKMNSGHANARKYLGETLVALGRSYEEENKIEEAKKAYQDCLNIIPRHEEAQNSLNFLWSKTTVTKPIIDTNDLLLPSLNLKIGEQHRDTLPMVQSVEIKSQKEKEKKGKKKKQKTKRKRGASSTSSSDSSESSESSSESSSSSDSSSSTSDSETSKTKKKRRKSEKTKQKSLSPLSKRMALLDGGLDSSLNQTTGQSSDPANDEYETRVRKFLELTRDEENYEEKVRKFVEEAARYRKDRKTTEETKAKKKERKKAKKVKKDTKKKRKEKKGKVSKKDGSEINNMEFREALEIFKKLPVFDVKPSLQDGLATVEKSIQMLKEDREKKIKATENNKWHMMFNKDNKGQPSTSRTVVKPFTIKSDEIAHNITMNLMNRPDIRKKTPDKPMKSVKPQPPPPPPPISPFQSRMKYQDLAKLPPKAPIGQVVLDKFGNFRLASNEPMEMPKPLSGRRSRSKRRYSSNSRSRSRSPKRRSRSRSFGRRYSRSRSRSFRSRSGSRSRSYSRSRSGSMDRRRDRRARGRGGFERGTYYKPRFGGSRGGGSRGGRFSRDFRGGRGRDRYRQWRGSSRYRGIRDDSRERRYGHSRSRSFDSEERRRSDSEPRRSRRSPAMRDGVTSAPDKVIVKDSGVQGKPEPTLEEIERMIEKGKKETKEMMIERNKDLVKKTSTW